MSINDSNETPLTLHPLPIFLRSDGMLLIGDMEVPQGRAAQVEFGKDGAVGTLRIENCRMEPAPERKLANVVRLFPHGSSSGDPT